MSRRGREATAAGEEGEEGGSWAKRTSAGQIIAGVKLL